MLSGMDMLAMVSCWHLGNLRGLIWSIIGNLHLNVVAAAYTPEIQDALEPFIYELVGTWKVFLTI